MNLSILLPNNKIFVHVVECIILENIVVIVQTK